MLFRSREKSAPSILAEDAETINLEADGGDSDSADNAKNGDKADEGYGEDINPNDEDFSESGNTEEAASDDNEKSDV